MNDIHVVLTVQPRTVSIAIGTTDIMGRMVDTIQATNPLPQDSERRHQAIGQLVDLALQRGATSIEIIIEKGD